MEEAKTYFGAGLPSEESKRKRKEGEMRCQTLQREKQKTNIKMYKDS